MRQLDCVLIAGINVDVIDGSSIWLKAFSMMLATRSLNCTLICKGGEPPRFDDLDHPQLEVIRVDPQLSQQEFVHTVNTLVESRDDLARASEFVLRGLDTCYELCKTEHVAARMSAYVTDLPEPEHDLDETKMEKYAFIARSAHRLIAQTRSAREFIESNFPDSRGKIVIWGPVIPRYFFYIREKTNNRAQLNLACLSKLDLVYAGKFAQDWMIEDIILLPEELNKIGISARLTLIGDKFQNSAQDKDFVPRLRNKLGHKDPRITWLGGLSREETAQEITKHTLGIGWRSQALDGSMEVSTKALEYAALGLVPLINDSRENREVFPAEETFFTRAQDARSLAQEIATALLDGHITRRPSTDTVRHFTEDYRAKQVLGAFSSEWVGDYGE